MAKWVQVAGVGLGGNSVVAQTPGPFIRTFTVYDTAVSTDAGPHVTVFGGDIGQGGTIRRITGTLRKAITADLVVRFDVIYPSGASHTIGDTFTIPSTAALDTPVKFLTFLWPTLPDLGVIVPKITSSDASKDKDGIASYTIEWVGRGNGQAAAEGVTWQGAWDSGTTYSKNDLAYFGGQAYLSLADSNTGNQPDTSPTWWGLIAAGTAGTITVGTVTTGAAGTSVIITDTGTPSDAILNFTIPRGDTGATGAAGPGVATGGTTGQILKKNSGTDYDTAWEDPPVTGVPTSRTITTTAPLTGGGDLTADRTFAIDAFTGDSGSGGAKGAVPAPASGDAAAGKFLKASGGWAVPSGGGGGNMNFRGAWSDITFAVGDVVTYSGGLYYRKIASGAGGSVAHVQSAAATNVHSLAFASDVTAGNLLVIAFSDESTVDPSTVTDTQGNLYTLADKVTGHTNNAAVYYAIASTTGPCTISYTTGGGWEKVAIAEFANVNAAVNVTATAYNSTDPSTVSITTTVANCLVYCMIGGYHSANTYTAVSGLTLTAQANLHDAIAEEYQIAATATTYTAGFNVTADTPDNSPVIAVAFTAGGAATPNLDTANWDCLSAS